MTVRNSSKPKPHVSSPAPKLVFVGSDKGGVGKSFISALVVDLLEVTGTTARVIQIDEQERLPALYSDRVVTVPLPRLEDMRRDPSAIVTAFDPLFAGIERTIADGVPTVVDIGGPQQAAIEEYCALVDLDSDLVDAGLPALWLVPATAEPEAMRGAVRTADAVGRVLPSIRRTIVLNRRDGNFKFYPNSPADRIWRNALEPLTNAIAAVDLPAIAPGSWAPFETAGRRFIEVVAAEISDVQAWTGRSRPAAKVLRGDVAAFLAVADSALGALIGTSIGGGDAE